MLPSTIIQVEGVPPCPCGAKAIVRVIEGAFEPYKIQCRDYPKPGRGHTGCRKSQPSRASTLEAAIRFWKRMRERDGRNFTVDNGARCKCGPLLPCDRCTPGPEEATYRCNHDRSTNGVVL